jgi:transposase
MPRALNLRLDFTANDLRRLAGKTKDGSQAIRLLALAAVAEGLSRSEAARIGGMKPQTLRLWVQRFNKFGPDGLLNRKSTGRPPKLTLQQKKELGAIVAAGPSLASDGVTRWRLADLVVVIKERFGVEHDEVSVRRILKELGFSYSSGATRLASAVGGGWRPVNGGAPVNGKALNGKAGNGKATAARSGQKSSPNPEQSSVKRTEEIDAA